jgi:PAS domain S-box-containing protein
MGLPEEERDRRLRLFEAIATTTPDFIYAFDLQGRFIYANRRLLEVWGTPFDKAIGKNLYELGYPQWHADMHMREIQQVIQTRQAIKGEVAFTGGSGISGIYEYIFSPVVGADGRVEIISGTTRDVTDRQRGDSDRNRLAAQLHLALDAAQMGWWRYDPATRTISYDFRFAEIFGITGEQKDQSEILTLVHQDDVASEHLKFEAAMSATDSKPFSVEYRVVRADGSVRWVESHGMAIFEGDGAQRRRTSFVGTVIDVTQRKRVESALRESEARLRSVVDATPECVKIVSPEGTLTYLNPAGAAMIAGDSGASLQGTCVYDLIAPEYREEWIQNHARVCAGEKLNWEYEIISLDGTRRFMETHAVPLLLTDGRTGQLAVTRDITRRKDDERAQAHLAAIVESSDDAIVGKTLDGIIRSWNTGARRIFGYTAEETIGRSVLMLLPLDRHDEETAILARLRAGERVDHYETVRRRKDGSLIDISLTVSPVRDRRGRIIGASKIARDITRQKHAERELQEAKNRADAINREKDELLESERSARSESERASRMKDEFLANLSHELRTPLNAILGWAQILRGSRNMDDIGEGVDIIERNARVQTQIIEDLLDMSRIISGKLRLDVQRVDLANIVQAAVETVRPAADARGIRLQIVLDPLAGPVSGDPGRLQQAFWNLLTNAVKFTPRGGRVQVFLERINSHLEVSVIDTGEGIDPAFLPHVFDRFRQADGGTTRRHGGLGLGLAIVKQLIELHGGTVRAKSSGKGCGSTFSISLPLTVIHPEPVIEPERRHPTSGAAPDMADLCVEIEGVRVLVVDDESDARTLIKRLLEDCKAVVTTAESADEAVKLLSQNPYDVLISDIGMPGEDGYSLIRRIRSLTPEQGRNVPALALTAYARAEDRMKAMLAGFEQHVVKPVEPVELITLVAILAGRSRR